MGPTQIGAEMQRGLGIAVFTVAISLFVVGCSPAERDPAPTTGTAELTPSAAEPSPSPSPSSASASPLTTQSYEPGLPLDDPVKGPAIRAWQEYWRVYDEVSSAPKGPVNYSAFDRVATIDETRLLREVFTSMREEDKIRTEGIQVFRNVGVSIDENWPDSVFIEYCADSSGVVRKSLDDGLVVSGDFPFVYQELARIDIASDGLWRVAEIFNKEADC